MVRKDFGSGLICQLAQTCMDSKVVRADLGSGLIRPRAQTCCAELRRLARLANSPGFKSFRCPRWRIKFSLERFADSVAISFASLAVEKFCRASSAGPPTALAIKFRKSDRVGRRGLFPMTNSVSSPAYRLQTAALENQQNSPDLRVLDCYSTHSEPWSALAPLNSRE